MLAAYGRAAGRARTASCPSSTCMYADLLRPAGRGLARQPSPIIGERCRSGFSKSVVRSPSVGGETFWSCSVRHRAAEHPLSTHRTGAGRGVAFGRRGDSFSHQLLPIRCFATLPVGNDDDDAERRAGTPCPVASTWHPHRTGLTAAQIDATNGSAAARRRRRRERAHLALCLLSDALRETDAARRRTGTVRAQLTRRAFSTGGSKPPASPSEKIASNEPTVEKESMGGDTPIQQRTDADFAEYLSGNSDEEHAGPLGGVSDQSARPASPSEGSGGTAAPAPPSQEPVLDEWRHLHRDHPDLALPSQREMTEADQRIERNQRNNVKKSIANTTANVRRALYGNLVILVAKFGAWMSSGSSAMLSEFIHSAVDCGNQSLLLIGLRDSGLEADRKHPYGYGKSVYFWALVSALGTFFLGAGVSMTHAVGELIEGPSLQEVTWHVWSVLGLSFTVDGYVLWKTFASMREDAPEGMPIWSYVRKMRDPATLAILLEDGAACLGIVIAIAGIGATTATGMPVFDGLAGVAISGLLAAMGVALVRVNHRFLLGQAVDQDITRGIESILTGRNSIENVYSVQSQWTGPDSFSYKAEVDFDGTFLAAKIMPRYQSEFLEARDTLDSDLRVLLSWYAEDVMRTVEREVRDIEAEIRKVYPGAEFIELEPMSKDSNRFAIDDGMEAQLKRIEMEELNRFLNRLYKSKKSVDPALPGGKQHSQSGSAKAENKISADDDETFRDGKKNS